MTRCIGSVIVTRDRRAVVEVAIASVLGQTRPPEHIFVVDNASSDDTQEILSKRADIHYVRSEENGGYAAGLAIGIHEARAMGCDAYWLLDDDSVPEPETLSMLEKAAQEVGRSVGLIGLRGGMFRSGRIQHLRNPEALATAPLVGERLHKVDFSLVDGALLLEPAARVAGPFRGEFFMMFEDIEFSWRIGQAGYDVVVVDSETIERGHLGSSAQVTPWRRFYLARNQLWWAVHSGRPTLVVGTGLRFARMLGSDLFHRRWASIRATLSGFLAALRNEMGRTLTPVPPPVAQPEHPRQ